MVESCRDYLSAGLSGKYEYRIAANGDCAAFGIKGVFPPKSDWLGVAAIRKNQSGMGQGFRGLAYFEAAFAQRSAEIVVTVGGYRRGVEP